MKLLPVLILFCLSIMTTFSQEAKKGEEPQIQASQNLMVSAIKYSNAVPNAKYELTYNNSGKYLTLDIDRMINGEWVHYGREVDVYDEKDNRTSYYLEIFNNGTWETTNRGSWTYNANGDPLIALLEQYISGAWVYYSHTINEYDENYFLTKTTYDFYNKGNKYLTAINTYVPDDKGNVLVYTYENWQSNSLVTYFRTTSTYDENNNETTYMYENNDGGTLVKSWIRQKTFDSNGNLLTSVIQNWKDEQWINSTRSSYTYDTFGNCTENLNEEYLNSQWESTSKNTDTFDSDGNNLTSIFVLWKDGKWVNSSRLTNTFYAKGIPLTSLDESWIDGSWEKKSNLMYTYDEGGRRTSYIKENWSNNELASGSFRWQYKITASGNIGEVSYDTWINNQWTPTNTTIPYNDIYGNMLSFGSASKMEYTFGNEVGVFSEETVSDIIIFPNPASDFLEINLPSEVSETRICNMYGETVLQIKPASLPVQRIDVSSLLEGMYFLNAGSKTKKFVVVR